MGIMQSHRGALRVQADQDAGTRFEAAFPSPPQPRAPCHRPLSQAPEWHWTGTGPVLLIEEDDAVRRVLGRLLSHLGFEVTAANGGASGLALFRRADAHFEFVVLDWSMPGFSGEQVLKALRERDIELPIILLSGYGTENLVPLDKHVIRAQKPMTLTQLQEAVCNAIGKPRVATH
jgi:DNA-binding NtrC family response regulator